MSFFTKDLKLGMNFIYDAFRYRKYYATNKTYKTEGKMVAEITLFYHMIEKGLSFTNFRAGFGQKKVLHLINLLIMFSNNFKIDLKRVELRSAISSLKNYKKKHEELNYELPKDLIMAIDQLVNKFSLMKDVDSIIAISNNKNYDALTFKELLKERHSIRDFTLEDIPTNLLNDSISFAQKAPSVCNRQATRVHVIRDRELKNTVLKIQGGTTGFSDSIPLLLMITFDLNYFYESERNQGYIDSGLFTMNLLHGLLVNNIGSCPLHWGVSFRRDQKLRKVIDFPKNEEVVLFIGIGFIPDNLKVAASNRIDVEKIITTHN